MKKLLTILLFFAVVLPAVGQKNKHSPTESYLQTKDVSYTPKIPKNEFSCDFELILSSNLTYKRKISEKIAIGATGKLVGFAFGTLFLLKNSTSEGALDVANFGLLMDYKINIRFYWEGTIQTILFYDGGLESTFPGWGIKNGGFIRFNRLEVGLSVFIGNISRGYRSGTILYTSLIILRIPISK